jgi:hypothetical protein
MSVMEAGALRGQCFALAYGVSLRETPRRGALRGDCPPAEGVAENAVGGWSEGEASPFLFFNIWRLGGNVPVKKHLTDWRNRFILS